MPFKLSINNASFVMRYGYGYYVSWRDSDKHVICRAMYDKNGKLIEQYADNAQSPKNIYAFIRRTYVRSK